MSRRLLCVLFVLGCGDVPDQTPPGDPDVPPEATDGALTTDEDTAASGVLEGSDADGDELAFAVATPPAHGTVVIDDATEGAYTYTPAADYAGDDAFTFEVSAAGRQSNPATVAITVNPVDDPPVAEDGSASTAEDTPVEGVLVCTDVDSEDPVWAIVTQGTLGVATLDGASTGAWSYSPDEGVSGVDTVTFACDDGTSRDEAQLTVTIDPVNDPPVAEDVAMTVAYDSTDNAGLFSATDPDSTDLTYQVVTAAQHGTVDLQDADAFLYTPTTGYSGQDTFEYSASDGELSDSATVTITVEPEPEPPTAQFDDYATWGNHTFEVAAADGVLTNDQGDEPLAVVAETITTEQSGSVTLAADGSFTYEPPLGHGGEDSFTYTVTNDAGSDTARVEITLAPVIWFVDDTADPGGDGRYESPASSLNAVEAAGPGHWIFLYHGSGSKLTTDNFDMKPGQRLLGEGVGLEVEGEQLVPPGERPVLGHRVWIGGETEIAGLDWEDTAGDAVGAVSVTLDGDAWVHDVDFRNIGGRAVQAFGVPWVLENVHATDITEEAFKFEGTRGVTLRNCSVTRAKRAVYHKQLSTTSADVLIEDCVFEGYPDNHSASHYAIWLFMSPYGDSVEIRRVTTRHNRTGIQVTTLGQQSANTAITDVHLEDVTVVGGGSFHPGLRLNTSGYSATTRFFVDGVDVIGGASGEHEAGADGLHLRAEGTARLEATVTDSTFEDVTETGIHIESVQGAPLVGHLSSVDVRADGTLTAGTEHAILAWVDAVSSLDLGLDGVVVGQGGGDGVRIAPASDADVGLHLANTEAADGFSLVSSGAISLATTIAEDVGATLDGTDDGTLDAMGNTTDGGTPSVSVTGKLHLVAVEDVDTPTAP